MTLKIVLISLMGSLQAKQNAQVAACAHVVMSHAPTFPFDSVWQFGAVFHSSVMWVHNVGQPECEINLYVVFK